MEIITNNTIVITVDDFHEDNRKLNILEQIHAETGAKFNLFTIPGLCSATFIKAMQGIDWIDLIPHGWLHPTPRECESWNYERCCMYLDTIEPLGMTHGFKAPGWQISDGMYRALFERGYWVADQHYNDHRRLRGLRVHYPEAGYHFHIGHMGGHNPNEIELHLGYLCSIRGEFELIKNLV